MNGRGKMKVQVRCYSGRKADERPLSIQSGDHELHVREIMASWYEPGRSCFRLRAEDGQIYILKHEEKTDEWELSLYPGQD